MEGSGQVSMATKPPGPAPFSKGGGSGGEGVGREGREEEGGKEGGKEEEEEEEEEEVEVEDCPKEKRTVFVSNLSFSVNEKQIKEMFSEVSE